MKESGIILHATFQDEEMAESKKGTFAVDGDTSNLIDIDFIGTVGRIHYVNQTCRTIDIYQDREKRPDHFPRAVDLVLRLNAQSSGSIRRTAGYDRKRTDDTVAVEQLTLLLTQLPKIPANVEHDGLDKGCGGCCLPTCRPHPTQPVYQSGNRHQNKRAKQTR